nr:hypothetical protein [Mycoplasmopsis bovis]
MLQSASVGNLLKAQGFNIFVLKLDPYLNIDPGVMNPLEHGEVYVTKWWWWNWFRHRTLWKIYWYKAN